MLKHSTRSFWDAVEPFGGCAAKVADDAKSLEPLGGASLRPKHLEVESPFGDSKEACL